MRQYTTPTIVLKVPADLTNTDVYVTMKQNATVLSIPDPALVYDSEAVVSTIFVNLTQEQTGGFDLSAPAKLQVNWIDENGNRQATVTKQVHIEENLLSRVVEYGEEDTPDEPPEEEGEGDGG